MKDRPILMSAPMVHALNAGCKTQTRRIAKIVNSMPDGTGWECLKRPGSNECIHLANGVWSWRPYGGAPDQPYPRIAEYCPYGQPGDRLWVKETWSAARGWDRCKPSEIVEKAPLRYEADGDTANDDSWDEDEPREFGRLRQSIFMRRWMSRIQRDITAVIVERLQDITEADAIAEGIERNEPIIEPMYRDYGWELGDGSSHWFANPIESYRSLWDSINAKKPGRAWKDNPWVWVVKFPEVA